MEKKQSNYWTDFRPIWWGEIKSWIGWGSLRQIITDTIIVAGSIILLFVGGEFDLANEEISVRVATMIFGAIWLFVIFVISYVRANQVLYTKQQENQYTQNRMITRLIKKLEGKPKKTTKVKIIPREEFPHVDEDGYYYAYLEVSNGENNDLIDCYANLLTLKVKIADSEQWGDYLDWVTRNTNELTWPKFDSVKDEKRIRRKNTERINIAKCKEGGHPIFMFADGREESMPEKRIYIEVSLNGEMYENGKSIAIEEIRFCGFLIWYQGTYTQEGGTITTTLNGITTEEIEPSEELPYYRFYIEPGELKSEKENFN